MRKFAKDLWWKVPAWAVGVIGVAGAAFLAGRSWAAGIPSAEEALNYSGTLTNPEGELLTGDHNVQVNFWRAATGGTTPLCQTASTEVTLVAGRFSIALPDTCVEAVQAGPNTFVEVLVDGSSLGRTRVGAVPYAIEAGSAESASGSLAARTDLKSLVSANAAAFTDQRLNSATSVQVWTDIAQRTVAFTKRFADSRVRVSYQDTLGSLALSYDACRWRILIGTTSILQFSAGDVQGTYGWRMDNSTHTAWAPASTAAGPHTVKVQYMVQRADAPATECLAGWNQSGGFLAVEEIP